VEYHSEFVAYPNQAERISGEGKQILRPPPASTCPATLADSEWHFCQTTIKCLEQIPCGKAIIFGQFRRLQPEFTSPIILIHPYMRWLTAITIGKEETKITQNTSDS